MRRFLKVLLIGAGGLLAICVLIAVLVSGGGQGGGTPTPAQASGQVVTTAASPATSPVAPGERAATATLAPQATPTLPWGTSKEDVHATLAEGQTAELRDGKMVYRLTIERIVDGATSTNPLQRPKEGNRYYLWSFSSKTPVTGRHS